MLKVRFGVEGGQLQALVARDYRTDTAMHQAISDTSSSRVWAIITSMDNKHLVVHVLDAIFRPSKGFSNCLAYQACLRQPSQI